LEIHRRTTRTHKTALKLLVETGDLKMISKLFNISLSELNDLRLKAKVPLILS